MTGAEYKKGRSRTLQLENHSEGGFPRFFSFEKVGYGKYKVNEIYDFPLPIKSNKSAGNSSVYLLYIELILLKYLSATLDKEVRFSKGKLWLLLGMINSKYNKIEASELKKINNSITDYEINNFYLRANHKLSSILERALKNLSDRSLIESIPQTIICKVYNGNKTYFEASDDDIAYLLKVKRQVLNELGFEKESIALLSKKKNEFFNKVNKILNDERGWEYYYKAFKIIFNREDIDRFIPRLELSLDDALVEFNSKIVDYLNNEAVSLYNKKIDEYNKALDEAITDGEFYEALNKFKYPQNYVLAQKMLANELISIDDIGKRIAVDIIQESISEEEGKLFSPDN